MITTEVKNKIAEAIRERSSMYPSLAKYATKLGINKSVLSRIINGETEKLLDNGRWVSIARILDVTIGNQVNWMRSTSSLQNNSEPVRKILSPVYFVIGLTLERVLQPSAM